MTTRRQFVQSIPALAAGIVLTDKAIAAAQVQDTPAAQREDSWHSRSLTDETATGPNGVVTTRAALKVNAGLGAAEKVVDQVIDGVYHIRGWGIAHSIAIDAPQGWIIIDAGDSTRAASEQRAMLEQTVGKKIKVAAILLTHWHYADGIAAWLDEGTELWGHELLDANRRTSAGVSVLRGFYLARAVCPVRSASPHRGAGRLSEPVGVHAREVHRGV